MECFGADIRKIWLTTVLATTMNSFGNWANVCSLQQRRGGFLHNIFCTQPVWANLHKTPSSRLAWICEGRQTGFWFPSLFSHHISCSLSIPGPRDETVSWTKKRYGTGWTRGQWPREWVRMLDDMGSQAITSAAGTRNKSARCMLGSRQAR